LRTWRFPAILVGVLVVLVVLLIGVTYCGSPHTKPASSSQAKDGHRPGAPGQPRATARFTPAPAVSAGQFVQRNGTQLVLNGQPFRFTGFNLLNANSDGSTCGPAMNNGPALDQALSAWGPGQKVMRSWFFQSMATSDGKRDWSAFDHTLSVARAHGVRVIATLGNQWGICDDGQYKSADWYKAGYRTDKTGGIATYRDWVAEFAKRYRDDPTIMILQFMNEAETGTAPNSSCVWEGTTYLRAFVDDIGQLVRDLDPNHLRSLGTIGKGQCGAAGDDYVTVHASPGIDICEFHDHDTPTEPLPGDQWNGLPTRLHQCGALNKPVFVGEVGLTPEAAGSLKGRADAFKRKFTAGFKAGVVGEVAWAWQSTDGEQIGPGDPALSVLVPS
jgi:mannan endo-1,4-beta-mannosidase